MTLRRMWRGSWWQFRMRIFADCFEKWNGHYDNFAKSQRCTLKLNNVLLSSDVNFAVVVMVWHCKMTRRIFYKRDNIKSWSHTLNKFAFNNLENFYSQWFTNKIVIRFIKGHINVNQPFLLVNLFNIRIYTFWHLNKHHSFVQVGRVLSVTKTFVRSLLNITANRYDWN